VERILSVAPDAHLHLFLPRRERGNAEDKKGTKGNTTQIRAREEGADAEGRGGEGGRAGRQAEKGAKGGSKANNGLQVDLQGQGQKGKGTDQL